MVWGPGTGRGSGTDGASHLSHERPPLAIDILMHTGSHDARAAAAQLGAHEHGDARVAQPRGRGRAAPGRAVAQLLQLQRCLDALHVLILPARTSSIEQRNIAVKFDLEPQARVDQAGA